MSTTGLRVAVVGASLGGLSAANVLRRLGVQVEVFEAFPHGFHRRGGALGAVDTSLLSRIRGSDAGPVRPIRGHGHFYGDLWAYLYEALPPDSVHFGVDIDQVERADTDSPALYAHEKLRSFDLVIGADGGASSVRRYVTAQTPSYAGYTVWRGLVPTDGIDGPPSGRRTVAGIAYETLGFPCAGPDGGAMWNCGVYMATPESEVAVPTRNRQVGKPLKRVPDWFVPFTAALFGARNGRFWKACARLGKVSPHAVWELASDRVVNRRIALLGDAAHMASPRTGAGAYTAMVDAVVLGEALVRSSSVDHALALYNTDTVHRGRQLFARSRGAADAFAPEGRTVRSPEQVLRELTAQS
ncbi:MAG: 2-polyprenyl-6-methoxyphenol hydroxylase-like FAD-dependent oxidoreductase [Myxococcota bacterium]|jgi:2-polyprenyl-6-methoxyphenol hydroxylase-like FAD-dependent oxidoreductase